MKMKLGTMAAATMMAASPVMADLVFPSLSYRTGPYAAGGIPFADGYADYFTLAERPRWRHRRRDDQEFWNAKRATTPKKALNATSPPKAKARWFINRSPPASRTS